MTENNGYNNQNAVDALFWREEILQVLYWMEGEGLEVSVPFSRLMVLLSTTTDNLFHHLKRNIEAGYLKTEDDLFDENSSVKLTPFGKKEAGNIFRNAFEGMQKAGHGECGPDCEFCYSEGEKLEDCVHNCADSRHHH
ncbi:MAG: hypothetical protein H0V14_07035 [Chitinophagaceae bacterium]|nr:hypothetical protein [Chitinophagaceae bacterium]